MQGLYLSQKILQNQVLAPQLRQALKLLQASALELRALANHEIQQNPVLEELSTAELLAENMDYVEAYDPKTLHEKVEPAVDITYDPTTNETTSIPADNLQAELDQILQLNQDHREHLSRANTMLRQSEDEAEKYQFTIDTITSETSLQECLMQQVRMSDLPREQYPVAEMIIGNIDDRGYLRTDVNELAFSTNIPADQIGEVVQLIQSFDPPGVGARNLSECMRLQLERAERQDTLEYRIVTRCMEGLVCRRVPEISRALNVDIAEVQAALERIARHIQPRPGYESLPANHQYVIPEIFVQKVDGKYVVTSNKDCIPQLRISSVYQSIMAQPGNSAEVREYICDKICAAKCLIKSLLKRQKTILDIAGEIVRQQCEFMEHGVRQLKPLTMAQVAAVVEVHESTVYRAVTDKYMDTPQGVYEMKYFFTSGLQATNGQKISHKSIKAILSELVRIEDR